MLNRPVWAIPGKGARTSRHGMAGETMTYSQCNRLARLGTVSFAMVVAVGAFADRSHAGAPADTAAAQYAGATGMMHRGLDELAAAEFQAFLSANGEHEKANLARYGLGVCRYRQGRCDDATRALRPLAELKPFEFRAEVLVLLGQCALEKQDFDQASTWFESAAREFPSHELGDDALAGAAEASCSAKKPTEAAAWARRLIEGHPNSPLRSRAGYVLGLSEMQRERYAEAAAAFQDLLKREPQATYADHGRLLLAQCLERVGKNDEASSLYGELSRNEAYGADALLATARLRFQAGQVQEAAESLDRLLIARPEGAIRHQAELLRARLWVDQKNYARALIALDELAATDGPDETLKCEAEFWAAKCRVRTDAFADAAERLDRAIRRHAGCELIPAMRFDLAFALTRADQLERAESALNDFLADLPNDALAPDATHLLALTQHRRGRYHESAATCKEFIGRHRDHALLSSVSFLYAEDEFLLGRFPEAVEAYRLFLSRYGKDERAARARLRLASALLRLDRVAEAEPLLKDVSNTADGALSSEANLMLGELCFDRGDWKRAEGHLVAAVEKSGSISSLDGAWLRLGLARQRQGDEQGALLAFDQLLERYKEGPNVAQAMFEKGQALATLRRHDEAAVWFERAMEADRESRLAGPALQHLAAIAAQRGDLDASAGYYARAARLSDAGGGGAEASLREAEVLMRAERFADAEKALASLVESAPSTSLTAQARLRLGVCQARNNQCEKAVGTLTEAIDALKDDALRALMMSGSRERAWCLRELGRAEDARKAYAELVALGEDGADQAAVLFELATLEAEAGRHDAAVDLLERVLKQPAAAVPVDLFEHAGYRIGVSEFERGRFREAAERMEVFVVAHPSSSLVGSASYYAGESNIKLGRAEAAAAHFERAARDGGDAALREAASLRLGESLAEAQQWPRSEQVFETFLSEFPASPHVAKARFGIGWAREHQGRHDEAITAYRAVTERHQGSTAARAQFQIGECLFARKRYEDAARELLKVDILYAYPEWSAAALFEAGRCLELLDKGAEAREQFRAVREKHGDTKWAELAGQRLSEMSSTAPTPGRQGS